LSFSPADGFASCKSNKGKPNRQSTVFSKNKIRSELLLGGDKTNQCYFGNFLFHLNEVGVRIDFAQKKNLFLTCFAHRKFFLWKSGGLNFEIFSYVVLRIVFGDMHQIRRYYFLANSLSVVILSASRWYDLGDTVSKSNR
jgi:hypothetical protein